LSRFNPARIARGTCLFILVAVFVLGFTPKAYSWGTSVHHDRATTIDRALTESPSIPAEVRENIDFDTIYMAITAPDEWRNATGVYGTYQWNMADNAVEEFQRIENAWALGGYDNAVYRIGVVSHFVGDAMQMEHNENLRDFYRNYIEPLGSDEPLWSDEESGGQLYPHHVRQQIEAYTDTDSAWYPRQPENYGTVSGSTDDGSLDWFLQYHFIPTMIDHIQQTNPNWPPGENSHKENENRWFYWVDTRDAEQAKMDADNDMRLTYNGVYRALRDGWNQGKTPEDPDYWDWPTTTKWLSLSEDLYGNGMDTVRWYHGQTSAEYAYGILGMAPTSQESSGGEHTYTPLSAAFLAAGLVLLISGLWSVWRSR
jgi:hypothetical protein